MVARVAYDTLKRRFEQLTEELKKVEDTRKTERHFRNYELDHVDNPLLLKWSVKVSQLFSILGPSAEQYAKRFSMPTKDMASSNIAVMRHNAAIFFAAKEDFDLGHINSLKNLISADLFDSQLDQARELLSSGYAAAAAVIAGIVLETTLQRICDDKEISRSRLNKMNDDLTKLEILSKLDQKKITAWAAVRNSAAHGDHDQFQSNDVSQMIEGIEAFISSSLA